MKYLLTISLLMVSFSAWSQTTQTPAFPPTPTSTVGASNGATNQFGQNFFGTNGLFTGDTGLAVRDLQANVEQLRALLSLIGSQTANGSFNGGDLQQQAAPNQIGQLNQNFSSASGVNFSRQDARNLSRSTAVTPGAFSPQPSVSPTVTSGFGALGASSSFGNNTAGQFSSVELQLLNAIQASLLNVQFSAQQLLPVLSQAAAQGGVGDQFATNAGFGALTNTFATPLTNRFGVPLTNNFGAPLTNTFGGLNPNTPPRPTGASAGGTIGTAAGSPSTGFGSTPSSPSTGFGTSPQSPSTGSRAVSQSPSTGAGAVSQSPSTGAGGVSQSPSTGAGSGPSSPSTGGSAP